MDTLIMIALDPRFALILTPIVLGLYASLLLISLVERDL